MIFYQNDFFFKYSQLFINKYKTENVNFHFMYMIKKLKSNNSDT